VLLSRLLLAVQTLICSLGLVSSLILNISLLDGESTETVRVFHSFSRSLSQSKVLYSNILGEGMSFELFV
jgi:hypothetical protein